MDVMIWGKRGDPDEYLVTAIGPHPGGLTYPDGKPPAKSAWYYIGRAPFEEVPASAGAGTRE